METLHNPDRYMSDLRQILSQGRKRIGLLVGAGAPVSIRVNEDTKQLDPNGIPLIPNVAQLTTRVIASLTEQHRHAVSAIIGEIGDTANIESILSKIRLLERVLGKTEMHGLNGQGYSEVGKSIAGKIGELVGAKLPDGPNGYRELVSWISGTHRTYAVEIFTTNYDLLFEEAFESARMPYFDGFTGGGSSFFDAVSVASGDLPARWTRLWKLHGSLGWSLSTNGNVVRGHDKSATELIYPDHLKYDLTQKQPYSSLFERLKQFLLTPDTLLLTTGFSFNDAHVCAVLDEALAMNANTAVFAFQYNNASEEKAATFLAYKHPNLSVYTRDSAIIRGVSGVWRPGELPGKQWEQIRASFWNDGFLLGDFRHFSRFCALSQATDMQKPLPVLDASWLSELLNSGAITPSNEETTPSTPHNDSSEK